MSTAVRTMYNDRYELVIDGSEVYVISHVYGKQRRMKLWMHQGYVCVGIDRKTIGLHRIVAKCYIGERPEGYTVNHKDGVKTNNLPQNLEYVTIAENVRHAKAMGLHVSCDPLRRGTYKDGRCEDIAKYKRDWYLANRDRILKKTHDRYVAKKQAQHEQASVFRP